MTSLLLLVTLLAPQSKDEQARDLFVAGQYAQALTLYDELHTTTHHPTYLRNIGRCHQMLRQPEPAIAHFQAYLREAHDVSPQEREEVQGYIREMEALRAAPAPPPRYVAPASIETRATPPEAVPVTRRWWFWTGVGAVVAAGVITAVAVANSGGRLPCPADTVCPP